MRKILSIFLCLTMIIGYIPVGMAEEGPVSSNADLSSLTVAGSVYYDLTPAFNAGTTAYAVDVPNDVSSVEITANTADTAATLEINGTAVASGSAQTVDNLATGDNTVYVEVTAADGITEKTYTMTIKRAGAGELPQNLVKRAGVSELPQTPAAYAASDYAKYAAKMAASGDHMAVVRPNGTVAVWGDNAYGQCDVPAGLTNVQAVAAGMYYTMALTSDGRLHCWGSYKDANNAIKPIAIPQEVLDVQGKIKLIAAGGVRMAVVTQDGKVIVWQRNGALYPTPEGIGNVVAVAVNSSGAVALDDTGKIIVCSTKNNLTQVPEGLNGNVVAIAAGQYNFLTLKKTGTVTGWGEINHVGASNKIFDQSNVRAITGGQYFAAALLADGSVRSWGTFSPPSDGNTDQGNELMAANANVKAISAAPVRGELSGADICILRGDGTVAVMGPNNCGQTQTPAGLNLLTQPSGSDAGLSSLEVAGYSLSPAFDASTTAYTVNVPNDVSSVSITATASDSNALLKSGALAAWSVCSRTVNKLVEGNNPIAVEVTAADGTTMKTYTLTIKRAAVSQGDNADLSGLSVAGAFYYQLTPVFDAATYAYTVNIPNDVESVNITAATADSKATLKINGSAATVGAPLTVNNLAVGDNPVTVEVTAADGNTVKTYTITINRAAASQSSNADLSGLVVVSGLAVEDDQALSHVLPGSYWSGRAYKVPNTTTSVSVAATTADSNASLTINGTPAASGIAQIIDNLAIGGNQVVITVTAADGATVKAYTLTIDRAAAAPDDNELAGLGVESVIYVGGKAQTAACELYPKIIRDIWEGIIVEDEVIVDVGYAVTEVRITALPSSGTATLEINGAPAAASVASVVYGSSLAVGDNLIPIKVTAADGSARTYTLHVKRVSAQFALPALPQTPEAYQASDYAAYARRLAAGGNNGGVYSLVLKKDRTVAAWGSNGSHQCDIPANLDNAVAVAAGGSFSLALKEDGTVVSWGGCNVPAGLSDVADISAGMSFSAALTKDGKVIAWGDNSRGECNLPASLNEAGNVVDIQCGSYHTLALKADGTVLAWGYNGYGQCDVPAGLNHVVAIAAGYYHSIALKDDGSLVIWGKVGNYGKDINLNLQYVKAIAATSAGAVAVKWDGSLAVWGSQYNDKYYGSIAGVSVPLILDKTVLAVSGSINGSGVVSHLLALYEDGTLGAWGNNDYNQCNVPVGLNLFADDVPYTGPAPDIPQTPADYAASIYARAAAKIDEVASGVAVLNMDGTVKVSYPGRDNYGLENVPSGLNNVKAIATAYFNAMALKEDGTVTVWGYDGDGQCQVPENVKDVTAIAVNNWSPYCLALMKDGTVAAWGGNYSGQCDVPAGLSGVTAIAAGYEHSLALKEDGTVAAWGANSGGQCDVPADLNNVARVYAGGSDYGFSLALKNDGTVAAWGDNSYGECDVPAGLSGVVDIALYRYTCVALKNNGTVVVWGENRYGVRNVPVGLHSVAAVTVGQGGVFAVKADGTVVSWGQGDYKNLWANTTNVLTIKEFTIIFRDGTLRSFHPNYEKQMNEMMAELNVLSGHYFAIDVNLLNPADSQPITTVGNQGGYRVQASVANNYASPAPGLTLIQVRGGSGATSTGGGRVLGCVGLAGEIPVSGSIVSSDFTMPPGVSGPAYVDVFVWDGWDTMVPRAKANQDLSFSVRQ